MKTVEYIYEVAVRVAEKVGGGFLGSMPTDVWSSLYTNVLRLAGANIGYGSKIHRRVYVRYPKNIWIGNGVEIPASTDMAGLGRITIDDHCLIGAGVRFITNHHTASEMDRGARPKHSRLQSPISVGRRCWIMNNVLLISGTGPLVIGDGAWIAAGSVVVNDVEAGTLVAGVPAKIVRRLSAVEVSDG